MDVHIIGAGPAGSIAALSAIRSGYRTTISEEHHISGLPENCSGLFSKEGLETLKPFIDPTRHIINPIHGADIFLNDVKLSVWKDEPVAYVCDRAGFDHALAKNAENEGAIVVYGERISSIDSFRATRVIGCDGPLSFVARTHGFPKIRRFAQTLQADMPYKSEDMKKVQVFLSNSRFPGFFGWIVPHNEETAEFGVGVEMPHHARYAWDKLLAMKGFKTDDPRLPKPTGAVIPLETRPKTAKTAGPKTSPGHRKILLAGDAAGQVKSTTGGGVIFGGNCAALAGRYADDPHRYELEWNLRYKADLLMHRLIRGHVARLSDDHLSAFGKKLKKMQMEQFLSRSGHMDNPTKMIGFDAVAHFVRNIGGLI